MATLDFIIKRFGPAQEIGISRFVSFPKLLRDLEFKVGAEIGVSTGRYSEALCNRIPGLKLYCIDPWTAYPEYIEAHDNEGQKFLNKNFELARKRLAGKNCEFIKETSMDALKYIEDESLDFVFIDGNHTFEYVIDDIAAWSRKVRRGGIVAGHDYWNSIDERVWTKTDNRIKLCQVKDAVDAWTKSNQIKQWFVLTGDRCPSWFWVKE